MLLLSTVFFLIFFLAGSTDCKDETPLVSPKLTNPLVGTYWKCLGFFDIEADTLSAITKSSIVHTHFYTIYFVADSCPLKYPLLEHIHYTVAINSSTF